MTRLTFDKVAVRLLVEHAIAAPKHGMGYGHEGPTAPCLILVKDDGIYLMSNGEPCLPGQDSVNHAVYAKGYNPKTDGDVWDKCRDAVGGDDFAEYMPVDQFAIVMSDRNATDHFQIGVTATKLDVSCEVKKDPAKRRAALFQFIGSAQIRAGKNQTLIVAVKKGQRNVKLWVLGGPPETVAKLDLTKRYRDPIILLGVPLEQAVDLYLKRAG